MITFLLIDGENFKNKIKAVFKESGKISLYGISIILKIY